MEPAQPPRPRTPYGQQPYYPPYPQQPQGPAPWPPLDPQWQQEAPQRKKSTAPLWISLGVAGSVIVLIVVIIALLGNGGEQSVATSPKPPAASKVAGLPPSTTGSLAAGAPSAGTVQFGQRYTWLSGLAVEVSAPASYQPSEYAAGHDRERAVVVTVTVVNGSDRPYDFNPFIFSGRATHGSLEAPSIADWPDLPLPDSTTILPGKSFAFREAFSIGALPADFQLEYTYDFFTEDAPAIFVGTV